MKRMIHMMCAAAIVAALGSVVLAVDIVIVPVGNAGNLGEWSGDSYGGHGPDRICGAGGYPGASC